MKLSIVLMLLFAVVSCKDRIDEGAKLVLTTKNETNHSVNVIFYPTRGGVRLVDDLVLPSLSQQDQILYLDAPIVPIGNEFPFVPYGESFVPYGELNSIRIVFDNSRFLSFRRPVNRNECTIPFNIFCANNQSCVRQSDSKGQCTYTIIEAMYNSAKPL